MQAELHADLEATMATMVDDPHLLNLASGTGGEGAAGVREFYATKLIGQFSRPMWSSSRSRAPWIGSGSWMSW
jgi:carboxymethylenebutenolidase